MIAAVSSVAIVTQGFIVLPVPSGPSTAALAASPMAKAKVAPAAPIMKSRRDGAASVVRSMWMVMAQASFAARSMARTMRG
jgi:hypothetical protein